MESVIPLISLISLEIILGIDNIIFISILADKLPEKERPRLRYRGIGLATVIRVLLLFAVSWILRLDKVLFTAENLSFTRKNLILIPGGLFLLYKSVKEIYLKTEGNSTAKDTSNDFNSLLLKVLILDIYYNSSRYDR